MEELDKWMNSMNRNGMWCGITEAGKTRLPLFITMPLDPGWDPVSPPTLLPAHARSELGPDHP